MVDNRFCVQATWEDVPHLSKKDKAELWNSYSPHEREARAKGIPSLGSGKIYPVTEESVFIDPIQIPPSWPRGYGFDVGWNKTAACWGAWDRYSDVIYIYSEHYMGKSEPAVHAESIKSRGSWINGAIDPASNASGQQDGKSLMDVYTGLGLNLFKANNAVEAGLLACYQRMTEGRLKIFKTCPNLTTEFRIYRRDENGKVVKENDHLMDAMRYLVMKFGDIQSIEPNEIETYNSMGGHQEGRSSTTGY